MALSNKEDVAFAYAFFLGRRPESEAVCLSKSNIDLSDMIKAFVGSAEFLVRVRDSILSLDRPNGCLFEAAPTPDLCAWVARQMPLAPTTRAEVTAAANYVHLYHIVFSDENFQLALSPLCPFRAPFLDCLSAMLGPNLVAPAIASGAKWLLITGAPCSGTTLLRAMLSRHPNVALLQEYGLTALIERVEAIIARPAPQVVDWSFRDETDEFAELSKYYSTHPARLMDATDDGRLDMRHFNRIATAILSSLVPEKTVRIVGDKMPMTEVWEDVPRLFSRLPNLQLIVVIRNPVDVVASSLNRRSATQKGRDTWPIKTVQEAVAQWIKSWQTTRALKASYPDAVHVLKYEDLCADAAHVIAHIDRLLDLPTHVPDIEIKMRPRAMSIMASREIDVLYRLLGPIVGSWDLERPESLLKNWSTLQMPVVFGRRLKFADAAAETYLISGFSPPCSYGRWIDNAPARLEMPHGETTGLFVIELWISQIDVDGGDFCDLQIRVVGQAAPKLFNFGAQGGRAAFASRVADSLQPDKLVVELIVATPNASECGARRRGICLESGRITHLRQPDHPYHDGVWAGALQEGERRSTEAVWSETLSK